MASKRPKIGTRAAQAAGVNVSSRAIGRIAAILRDAEDYDPDACSQRSLRADVSTWGDDVFTPVGKIFVTIDLPLDDGSTLPWKICSPFALMWYLASLSFAFSCLLEKTLSNVTSNIALWGDEGTGGNPLRPDEHNKFLMLYMTFHEWPSYWRSLDEGWLPLGCISYAMLHRVKSKYSGVLRALLMYMLKGWIGLGPPTSLSQRLGPSRRRSLVLFA